MYQHIKTCRACGSNDLFKYLNLGEQPLANSYHRGTEELEKIPLEVNVCENCFNSQLSIVVDPDYMFKHYLYVSGTTTTLKSHFDSLAQDAMSRVSHINPKVLDIACNDGSLLESFRKQQASVYGVDPAENLRELTLEKEIPVLVDYWSKDILHHLPKFDIITATNVFAHVNDTKGFLETCSAALAYFGIVVLEFPYAVKMLKQKEFDTIYHEHLSYFLVNSMNELCLRTGFRIIDILQSPIHGGSIRFILSQDIETPFRYLNQMINDEKQLGILSLFGYQSFQKDVEAIRDSLLTSLNHYEEMGIPVVGYGASAKGNTLLNFAGINLKYIVDDNELKWGYLTPGMDIPIRDPKVLQYEPDGLVVLVLSWNFLREIQEKVLALRRDKKTILVTYEPSVREFVI